MYQITGCAGIVRYNSKLDRMTGILQYTVGQQCNRRPAMGPMMSQASCKCTSFGTCCSTCYPRSCSLPLEIWRGSGELKLVKGNKVLTEERFLAAGVGCSCLCACPPQRSPLPGKQRPQASASATTSPATASAARGCGYCRQELLSERHPGRLLGPGVLCW